MHVYAFTISMKVISLPAPLHPTALSQPIYETMAHLEDGKRSANTNMKSNSVSKSDLGAVFETAKNISRSLVKTWRSAFDWLNIVSKSSNNRQQKNTTMKSNGVSKMTWIVVLEACKSIFRSTGGVFPVTFVPNMSTISLVNERQ